MAVAGFSSTAQIDGATALGLEAHGRKEGSQPT